MHIFSSEKGMSMLKTLLAVVCIAIGSIWGVVRYFDYLNQTAAENIILHVKNRAVVASPQRMSGQEIDLSEFYLKQPEDIIRAKHLVTSDNSYRGDSGLFTITVNDVSQAICEHILTTPWDWPKAIALNGAEAGSGGYCTHNTQMTFVFVNHLKTLLPLEGSALITHPCDNVVCPSQTRCVDGKCLCDNNEEKCGNICCAVPNTCQGGTCVCDNDWQKIFKLYEERHPKETLPYGFVCLARFQQQREGMPTPQCLDYEVSYQITWKGCSWATEWVSAHKPASDDNPTDLDDIEINRFPADAVVQVNCRAKLLPNVPLLELGQKNICGMIPE